MRGQWTSKLLKLVSSSARARQREPLFLQMLVAALRDGTTLVEIGSSDGCETVEALLGGANRVSAVIVEPDPSNLATASRAIRRAVGANAPVRFVQAGVSDTSGRRPFYLNRAARHLNSAVPRDPKTEAIEVDYLCLPELIDREKLKPPLLLKMDIEGHEVEVLRGGFDYLSTHAPIGILMEVHPEAYMPTHSLANVLERLFAVGYRTTLLESAGLPMPRKFREAGLVPEKIAGRRGLYRDVANDRVLDFACTEHVDVTERPTGITRKIVRSLLLERE